MSTATVLMFDRSRHVRRGESSRGVEGAARTLAAAPSQNAVLPQDGRGGDRVTAEGRRPALRRPVCGGRLQTVQAQAKITPPKSVRFYRKYTEGMLRRYVRMSMEAGRVPSMLGRELFRGKVSSYEVHSFEDVVIFVCDVEKCVALLDEVARRLVTRIGMQEYTPGEVAGMLGMSERTTVRRYLESLDELSDLFLRRGLLQRMPGVSTRQAAEC